MHRLSVPPPLKAIFLRAMFCLFPLSYMILMKLNRELGALQPGAG